MPHHDGAVLRAGHDVTVLVDVGLRPGDARDDVKVAVDHLGYTGCKTNVIKLQRLVVFYDKIKMYWSLPMTAVGRQTEKYYLFIYLYVLDKFTLSTTSRRDMSRDDSFSVVANE